MIATKFIKTFALACLALLLLPCVSFSKEEKTMTKEDYLLEIDIVKAALEKDPESAELHNTLGFYYYKIEDDENAESEYLDAITYDEEFAVPFNNLGILSLKKKQYKVAEKYFNNALKRNPKYAKAVYNLGVTYFRQKKYIKAVKYYYKAKDVDKEYVKEREDKKKGRAELEKALKEDPDNDVLQYLVKKANEEENK